MAVGVAVYARLPTSEDAAGPGTAGGDGGSEAAGPRLRSPRSSDGSGHEARSLASQPGLTDGLTDSPTSRAVSRASRGQSAATVPTLSAPPTTAPSDSSGAAGKAGAGGSTAEAESGGPRCSWLAVLAALVAVDVAAATALAPVGGAGSIAAQLRDFPADYKALGDLSVDMWVCAVVRAVAAAAACCAAVGGRAWRLPSAALRPLCAASTLYLVAKVYARAEFPRGARHAATAPFAAGLALGWVLPLLQVAVAAALAAPRSRAAAAPAPAAAGWRKPHLGAIASLRFVAAAHIVCYHFNKGDRDVAALDLDRSTWNLFCNWGGAQLTFFFALSGFILAYQYGDRPVIQQTDFWVRRWARLYPLYLAAFAAGAAMATDVPAKTAAAMLFCVQVWVDGTFENQINVPSWAVGAFLMLYAVFPPLVQVLATASTRLRWRLLPLFWGFSALGAGNAMGYNWTGIYGPVCHVLFAAHTPAFVFGACLGLCYLDAAKERARGTEAEGLLAAGDGAAAAPPASSLLSLLAAPLSAMALAAVMLTANVFGGSGFLAAWAPNGLLLPLFGGLMWGAADGRDPLSRLLAARPLQYLGSVSFAMYLVQAPVRQFAVRHLAMNPSHWDRDAGVFVPVLLATAVLAYHAIEVPCGDVVMRVYRAAARGCAPRRAADDEEGNGACCAGVPTFVKIVCYYILFVAVVGGYITLSLDHKITKWGQWDTMLSVEGEHIADRVVNGLKWLALVSMPALLFTTIGHLCIPPARRVRAPTIADMLDEGSDAPHMRHRLHFRIVTRGLHPLLVAENVEHAGRVLEACLPAHKYEIEVVADNPMDLQNVVNARTAPKVYPVTEITVPKEYKTREVDPAKYKARALHYAIEHSSATGVGGDWIIHLDEETQFSRDTVRHIYYHCALEEEALAAGRRAGEGGFQRIGQGPILYGANDVNPAGANQIENWLTTLADSIRVADDFGKFRLQYWFHEPLIGMHGSFVVASQAVEAATTFNHGMIGSITEDAYFSLIARDKGVRFSWVDAFMFEQSPFSVLDFAKQRKRWFAGLLLVCVSPEISRRLRATLGFMVLTWAFTPVIVLAMLLCVVVGSDVSIAFRVLLSTVAAVSCWGYMLGFVWTFSPLRGGWVRYIVLAFFQWILQPFFALMEIWGVAWALVDRSAYTGFHIVKKESKSLQARQQPAVVV